MRITMSTIGFVVARARRRATLRPPPVVNTDVSMPLENARPSPMTIRARMSPGSATQLLAERAQLVPHLGGEAVQLVRPGEHQPPDVPVPFEAQCVHGSRRYAIASAAGSGRGTRVSRHHRDRRAEARDRLRPDRERRDLGRQLVGDLRGREHLERLREVAEPRREVHRAAGVVVALEQDDATPRQAGAHRQQAVVREPLLSSTTALTSDGPSTATSIAPSPSHLAMRTPTSDAIERTAVRNWASTATASSSPWRSVKRVKPERSTKAKVLGTRMPPVWPATRPPPVPNGVPEVTAMLRSGRG